MKKFFVICFIFFFLISEGVLAINVGVAPPVINMGPLEPGTQVSGSFYVVTDGVTEFIVDLSSIKTPDDFYEPTRPRIGYTFDATRASEQDASKWITFLENAITIPTEKYFVGDVNAWVNRKIDFIMNVPADAEPGYHAIQIIPSPRVSSTGGAGGVGVGIVTIVKTTLIFTIPGEVKREAEILGFDYKRTGENFEEIFVLVKNTGTVTISVKLDGIIIDEGDKQTFIGGSGSVIKPNQIARINARYEVAGKNLGSYKATATISWKTGETRKDGIIEILEYYKTAPITGDIIAPPGAMPGFPFWVAPMLIILFAIVIYWWRNGKS
jgi:hypothetical protein